jgi:hypothetical protein
LALNDAVLLERDIYIPRSGRHHPGYAGQHNIAWELSEHPEYTPQRGTLAELVEELRARPHESACISAEDFEFIYNRPDRIRLLQTAIVSAGYDPYIIVYLRPQAQYCVSLYAEYIKIGAKFTFAEYISRIIQTGTFGNEPHATQFDYERLLENFATIFGDERMIVRAYKAGNDSNELLGEFLDIISPPEQQSGLRLSAPDRRLNVTPVPPDAVLDEAQLARLVARFTSGNEAVARRFGVSVPVVAQAL